MCENEDLYSKKTRVYTTYKCKTAYLKKFGKAGTYGYYLAKQIIKLIWAISEEIRKNPKISKKLSVSSGS